MRSDTLRLKQPSGWFAATSSFRTALELLSDGAFKLFACLCLDADRPAGRLLASQKDLAARLGKSRRALAGYVKELEQKGICTVEAGRNQFASSRFEVSEAYWPYHRPVSEMSPGSWVKGAVESTGNASRENASRDSGERAHYVASIRECFLGIECASRKFSSSDERAARRMIERAIPLGVVMDAMLLGSYRKYESWLNRRIDPAAPAAGSDPIVSLAYFEPLIEEVRKMRISSQDRALLQAKASYAARRWKQIADNRQRAAASPDATPTDRAGATPADRAGRPTDLQTCATQHSQTESASGRLNRQPSEASSDTALEPSPPQPASDAPSSGLDALAARATQAALGAQALREVLVAQKSSKQRAAACAEK